MTFVRISGGDFHDPCAPVATMNHDIGQAV
jgi:hypothetical protein